jgi:hypothetical protein
MRRFSTFVLLGLLASPAAHAEEPTNTLLLYVLGVGIGGEAEVGPYSTDIDVPASEVFDHLEFGAMGSYRRDSGKWSFQADGLFASLAGEQTAAAGLSRTTLDLDQLMFEVDGGYELTDNFELVIGARYWDFDTRITLQGQGPTGTTIASSESSRDWVDPLIGVRVVAPIGDRWTFVARGDVGGFGVGSDFAWHVTAFFNWHFGENFSVLFGYRFFDFEFEDRGGADQLALDMQESGPGIGIAWSF